jgi:hypothetical protein
MPADDTHLAVPVGAGEASRQLGPDQVAGLAIAEWRTLWLTLGVATNLIGALICAVGVLAAREQSAARRLTRVTGDAIMNGVSRKSPMGDALCAYARSFLRPLGGTTDKPHRVS